MYGMHSKSERKWNSWGPWPPKSMSSDQVQTACQPRRQSLEGLGKGSERGPAREQGAVLFHYMAYVSLGR